jgi:hypothetical protein
MHAGTHVEVSVQRGLDAREYNAAPGVAFFLYAEARCCTCPAGEGGLSRTNQYLRYIIANLEELRTIKEYRTRE